jgi:hypothetical protein
MNSHTEAAAGSRAFRALAAWIAAGLFAVAGQAAAALAVSPASVSVPAGSYSVVKITGARG